MKINVIDEEFGKAIINNNDITDCSIVPMNDARLNRILSRKKPYTRWNIKIRELHKEHHEVPYGKKATERMIKTPRFQVLNFLASYNEYSFSRDQLTRIQNALVEKEFRSLDVIQVINKTDQNGMNFFSYKWKNKTWYSLAKIEFCTKRLIRTGKLTNYNEKEQAAKQLWHDFACGSFEKGHKDPRKPLTDDNVVPQPQEINRSYRDTYIFDDCGLPICPTPNHILNSPNVLSKYWSKEEYIAIRAKLDEVYGIS